MIPIINIFYGLYFSIGGIFRSTNERNSYSYREYSMCSPESNIVLFLLIKSCLLISVLKSHKTSLHNNNYYFGCNKRERERDYRKYVSIV